MMTIIRHKYEGQLGELIKDIRHLGLRVYFNLEHALVSLSEDDKNYARQVIENDKDINNLDYDINEKVIMLITKQTDCYGFKNDDGGFKNFHRL